MLKQLLVILFSEVSNAHFTDDFNTWLMEVYGSDVQTTLNRADLGRMGSFGGKQYRDQMLTNDPIVFVHGVSNTAGEQPFIGASYFLAFGYDWSELYATTYANGAEGNPMQWAKYTMNCKYVKQIRGLIVAVRLYTGRAVDVIAYSLGVPVARKAILGGLCVDTKENLGNPLTSSIDTFVGIAGPNHGVMLKFGFASVPVCIFNLIPICNQNTGLFSGICPLESSFLKDINSVIGYEGKNIFTIYSKGDQLVGYNICGKITSQITGQHGEKVYNKKDHNETFRDSLPVQLQMILHHIVI
ncbi:Lipase family protein [Brugia malayi]|uniref:Lipase family protein n=1 Tax=Brugia malayi TaxID=6279 RepID=A0A4E9FEH0_BRUMA|nr:Lipase family protein [Brugia malayi]VIO94639.1 Lipase family protein [Brugia malayi]